ncbi:MAG: hypothetical protein Q4C42_10960, partial [Clostridia bacterium]|nr:hypothetical protein [Clostridia bacterium]
EDSIYIFTVEGDTKFDEPVGLRVLSKDENVVFNIREFHEDSSFSVSKYTIDSASADTLSLGLNGKINTNEENVFRFTATSNAEYTFILVSESGYNEDKYAYIFDENSNLLCEHHSYPFSYFMEKDNVYYIVLKAMGEADTFDLFIYS